MKWLLVAIIVATVFADLLQSLEMKRQAVSVEDLRPGRPGRFIDAVNSAQTPSSGRILDGDLVLCVHQAASMADLSFAVPVTAASIVFETVLAKLVLGESVTRLRWAGAFCVASGAALLAA